MKVLHHPDREDIQLSSVLYALSDPIRLYIVNIVYQTGERTCGDIEAPVVKSTMSHHFRTLRELGIIHVRLQGTQRFCTVRTEDLEARFPGLLLSILHAFHATDEAERLSLVN